MKHGLGMSFALMLCAAAEAADPPPATPQSATPKAAAPRAASRRPLALKVGDVRKYMMPNDFLAAVNATERNKDTIVVEGARELLPMDEMRPIPAGFPPATLWWAARHPAKSWRVLLPDLNAPAMGPT